MPDPGFHIMTKPIGPLCNLDCSYCFYLEKEKLYPGATQWAMPPEVLERYISEYIAAQPPDAPEIHFAWQGGEPTLLGLDFFRNIVTLQQKHTPGKVIRNALQTNATLVDEEWAAFLAEHNFLVGVSIDGPRELHDCYRVDKGQAPTFDRVLRGIARLKAHNVEFNTLTVVHRKNAQHPLDVYRFLKEAGSGFIQFIPVVERKAAQSAGDGLVLIQPSSPQPAEVTDWSVEPLAYGKFLAAIFDEWVKQDVGRVFIQQFDVALESWLGLQQSLCVFRPTCGSALALEHNGDLYSCDHFVYPEHKLGNIADTGLRAMTSSAQQRAFGLAKRDMLPRMCRQCDVRFACNGECPKHRFLTTPDGEPGLNYLCAGYKHFFHHIDPFMQFMASELRAGRPPANIMRFLGR
ncbi:anaerobic sulfatase maturase [Occallatibacter riparius]|uniref:Anaerobic sulfatase maturase n=1 Tax=Occallatibacter riparius TaxID=1002689 RepID=A0A9J7BY62_9BACT|nr:anaerobic sulfatase maturase [Occallatibacter riparius]UWZ86301.1 anaerobic sulfatase maturase [Occallatibacter riparius]